MTDFSQVWQQLPGWGYLVVGLAALLVGFSKTAIANVAMLSVAACAALLPTKESTGAILTMYLVADLVAIWVYRRHVAWRLIGRMMPPVAAGIAVGAVFLNWVSDWALKRTIGVILLALLVVGLRPGKLEAERRPVAAAYGGLAGFTTMVANAGGPAFSLYLLAARFDKLRFLGTSAWFYFAINVAKLPVSIVLGVMRPPVALFGLAFAPVVLVGAVLGRRFVARLDQGVFDRLVMVFIGVAVVCLLVG
ncbi:MAG: sulfite exporter TauE/SafE family protein [Bifidobacteriaceae bacterium]|nr:sulfite exporter TauE/SafE family protein [Bifidobacteriaceae bacterium]